MSTRGGTILLSDGDVSSLVALAHAAEAAASGRETQGGRRISVLPMVSRPSQRAAVKRQAAFYGADLLPDAGPSDRAADLLLAAGRLASEQGGGRVIWPERAGVAADPEEVDVDLAANLVNTALLVERLLEIESATGPTIEVPFADLSDRQMVDLAIDLGFVPGDVWWAARSDDEQLVAGERWAAAFQACGVALRAPVARRAGSGRD